MTGTRQTDSWFQDVVTDGIHLRWAHPRTLDAHRARALQLLSTVERERYETTANANARDGFLLGRLLLRELAAELVAGLTGHDVSAAVITVAARCADCGGPHGQAVVSWARATSSTAGAIDKQSLHTSVAHSSEAVVVVARWGHEGKRGRESKWGRESTNADGATSRNVGRHTNQASEGARRHASQGGAIGVDVEPAAGPIERAKAIAAVTGYEGDNQLLHWTRVEAVLKADGRGLRVDPRRVRVEKNTAQLDDRKYQLLTVNLDPTLVVSVAVGTS